MFSEELLGCKWDGANAKAHWVFITEVIGEEYRPNQVAPCVWKLPGRMLGSEAEVEFAAVPFQETSQGKTCTMPHTHSSRDFQATILKYGQIPKSWWVPRAQPDRAECQLYRAYSSFKGSQVSYPGAEQMPKVWQIPRSLRGQRRGVQLNH